MHKIIVNDVSNFKLFRIGFEALAYITLNEDIAEIVLLNVDKHHRNNKLGTTLLNGIINSYKELSFKTIRFFIPVNIQKNDLTNLISFIEKFGFEKQNDNIFELDLQKNTLQIV